MSRRHREKVYNVVMISVVVKEEVGEPDSEVYLLPMQLASLFSLPPPLHAAPVRPALQPRSAFVER